jgi:hypothetical protein
MNPLKIGDKVMISKDSAGWYLSTGEVIGFEGGKYKNEKTKYKIRLTKLGRTPQYTTGKGVGSYVFYSIGYLTLLEPAPMDNTVLDWLEVGW